MPGKQVVTAPNGERWQVGRRWLNRSPLKPWSRRKRRDTGDASSWLRSCRTAQAQPSGFARWRELGGAQTMSSQLDWR
jgi:hypothetical protein